MYREREREASDPDDAQRPRQPEQLQQPDGK